MLLVACSSWWLFWWLLRSEFGAIQCGSVRMCLVLAHILKKAGLDNTPATGTWESAPA